MMILAPFSQMKSSSHPLLPPLTTMKQKTALYQQPITGLFPTTMITHPRPTVPPLTIPSLPLSNQNNLKQRTDDRNIIDTYGEEQQQQQSDNREHRPPRDEFDEDIDNNEQRLLPAQNEQTAPYSTHLSPHEKAATATAVSITENGVDLDTEEPLTPTPISPHSGNHRFHTNRLPPNETFYQARALAKFAQWKLARYDTHLDEVLIFSSSLSSFAIIISSLFNLIFSLSLFLIFVASFFFIC
jgi:hypothetical protein